MPKNPKEFRLPAPPLEKKLAGAADGGSHSHAFRKATGVTTGSAVLPVGAPVASGHLPPVGFSGRGKSEFLAEPARTSGSFRLVAAVNFRASGFRGSTRWDYAMRTLRRFVRDEKTELRSMLDAMDEAMWEDV